jgi:sulfite reductase beta subunit-like hemoprotein
VTGTVVRKYLRLERRTMRKLKYLSEIAGYEKIVKICGKKAAKRFDKEIEYFEHLPQKRFEKICDNGTVPRIYAVYCGMYSVEEYLGII